MTMGEVGSVLEGVGVSVEGGPMLLSLDNNDDDDDFTSWDLAVVVGVIR